MVFDLPENSSARAARLLAAANELLVSRGAKGFTVADVAARAHVGKGTVYLYWPTKEDLLLGLIGREFLRQVEAVIQLLEADGDLARPSRFCSTIVGLATSQPLIAALQRNDHDLLGMLTDDPRSRSFHAELGPAAMLRVILPLWRESGLARTDWELEDQVFALNGLIGGFTMAILDPSPGPVKADDPLAVLGKAVTALLGPERATKKAIRSTADRIDDHMRTCATIAMRMITSSEARKANGKGASGAN
ncbi:TetR/AcrR family transcriptional regulator [Arthrobacter sp. SLBN-53]|uniref:TetR/AcrR family transcriptional regulator n=1 Tax=Arthrobacter sp. SLBN-53 TaxID=2768412 RepID=UPI00114E024C|nr:TetR/AcrR family transcriptional regulator [Arthrobacter sp. SLBN-53]